MAQARASRSSEVEPIDASRTCQSLEALAGGVGARRHREIERLTIRRLQRDLHVLRGDGERLQPEQRALSHTVDEDHDVRLARADGEWPCGRFWRTLLNFRSRCGSLLPGDDIGLRYRR